MSPPQQQQQQQQPPQQKRRRRRRRPGDEEEPVLRTTCDACTSAKVKCNGEKPCTRCGNKNIQCEYTFKKRCGPKRRKGVPSDGGGLLAPYSDADGGGGAGAGTFLGFGDHLRGESTALTNDEVECVDVFMQNINSFLPLTTIDTIKRAAKATAPGGGGDGSGTGSEDDSGGGGGGGAGGTGDGCLETQYEDQYQIRHARKAMLHGAIALGAEFLEKEEESVNNATIARQEIKECFDAAVPELVAAHLILALYWTHQMDSNKITRYIGLAHQSNGIICDPPGPLVAALTFVSVILYDAKVVTSIGCRVEPPGSANRTGLSTSKPAACQERVLNILSFVLLAIHNRSSSSGSDPAMATGEWDPKVMTEHVYEAKALLDKGSVGGGPNDISRCIVVVLQAYFLLLTDNRRQAIVITEPLADLVADNPLVLHLPIVWSLVGCVRVLLKSANRSIAVERLESAMEPLASHLGFSTDASFVEQELMSVFAGKPAPKRRGGATTAVTAAEAAAAAAARGAQDAPVSSDVLVRQNRGQTSSLNVTAGDYSHRGRTPIANMIGLSEMDAYSHPEPSAAPRRRGLPSSSAPASRPDASRSNGIGGGGGVSQSLLSVAMASGGEEPLLPSAPPPSRAGALSRASGTRGSLSIPEPFGPAAVKLQLQPMLQVGNMPFMSAGGFSAAPKEELDAGRSGPSDGVGVAMDTGGPGKIEGGRAQLMRRARAQASFSPDAPMMSLGGGEGEDGRQQSFKADAPVNLEDGVKLEEDRRELMSKQQVQQSFVADAEVTLDQVESNMARLGVSHDGGASGEGLGGLVSSMNERDLDAAAELLATKSHFIS